MNIVLLHSHDFIDQHRVSIADRRFQHLQQVNKVSLGDSIQVGLINDKLGVGIVEAISDTTIELNITLNTEPPKALPLHLIIALPRPKMLKRILQTCATMGVKKITFINSYRVEKSYWQTPWLKADNLREQFLLGLEQGKDTLLPKVNLEQRFKPFVEDTLPKLCQNKLALLAHPNSELPCPLGIEQDCLLIIGPEGGFIDYEVDKLEQAGCQAIHLGERILRVETAVPVLLSKLF